MYTTNSIITASLLVGLLLITLSFVQYRRKALLMLRALFSARFFQQLLREGKLFNERINLYTILLDALMLPCLFWIIFHFYIPQLLEKYAFPPLLFFGSFLVIIIVLFGLSRLLLSYFSILFNYHEYKYLYSTCKSIYRFYNALLLMIMIPIIWYACIPELIIFVYLPLFLIIFFAFFVRFYKNISGISRIHFFVYFCTLEILPYLLIAKLLITNI